MATKARQIYTADEQTLHKDKRTLEIESWYKTKIDWIEAWAEVNTIETIKVNWSEVEPDANRAVDLTIPNVIDNVSSVSSTDALSANMGRALAEEIQNLKAQWRFLSFWNAAAGRPTSEPPQELYTYHTWDYFIVNQVAVSGWTNYRPDGTTYTRWQVSSTVETEAVVVWSEYVFDWTIWLMLARGGWWGGTIIVDENLSTTSHNPVWNATITNALNTKEVLSNKVTSLANPSNTTYPTTQAVATELNNKVDDVQVDGVSVVTSWVASIDLTWKVDTTTTANQIYVTNDSGAQSTIPYDVSPTANTIAYRTAWWRLKVWSPSATWDATTKKYVDDALAQKQNVLTAGSNIDITNNVISATDTTYTAWDWIDITWTVISSTVTSDVTDVKVDGNSVLDDNKVANIDLSWKQDVLTAWHNITITNNTISSVDELPSWGTVWQVLTKTSSGTAWWDMSEWDMKYEDFEFASKSWASVVLDLSSTITPTSNFTVNVPTEIKEWQIYVLRVTNWATSYTMTLWEWITNPRWTSLSLTANTTDQFVFYAVSNSVLELQAEWWWSWWPENIFVTQAEYDALTPEAGKTYFIYEEEN